MRATRFGGSIADLLRSTAARVCAAALLGLLMAGCPSVLIAQTGQSSSAQPMQKQPQAKPKSQPGQISPGRVSSAQANSSAQPQDQDQGDQSLQPDPLANPVNPPPTPEEPAADDSDAAWPGDSSPASPPSDFPGPPAASPVTPPAAVPTAQATPPTPQGAAPAASPVAAHRAAAFAPPPVPPPVKTSDSHRQKINNQCASLLTMANALKMAVDKTTEDELSVTVVRTADQIEQLARQVKDEMRPTASRN